MKKTFGVIVALICLWGFPGLAEAEKVTVSSSTQGVRLTTELVKPVRVALGPHYPVVSVWVREVAVPSNGSDPCPTGLTDATKGGVLLARYMSIGADPTFHEFKPLAGWSGGNAVLCAILHSGSSPVDVYTSFY
jgi:hypothetical protein